MRGFVFMLEAVLASLLLVGFLIYLAHTHVQAMKTYEHDFGWVLPDLEKQSLLRGYVYSGDIPGLEGEVSLLGFNHSVQICTPSGGCSGQAPHEENVWASYYFLAGQGSYNPREVRLYVWEA